jgi:hypothetical protein
MLALDETGAVLKISFTTMPHALGPNMKVQTYSALRYFSASKPSYFKV